MPTQEQLRLMALREQLARLDAMIASGTYFNSQGVEFDPASVQKERADIAEMIKEAEGNPSIVKDDPPIKP